MVPVNTDSQCFCYSPDGQFKRFKKPRKITATGVMYICAVQIVLTTIGFILYKRPYLWAWTALEYYNSVICGDDLNQAIARFEQYSDKLKPGARGVVAKYQKVELPKFNMLTAHVLIPCARDMFGPRTRRF